MMEGDIDRAITLADKADLHCKRSEFFINACKKDLIKILEQERIPYFILNGKIVPIRINGGF